MSHEAHDVDCGDVLEAVYLYLDGELDGEALEEIRQHLDDCSPCLREYGIEREVKVLIARSCGEVAPASLHGAVVDRIRIVRTEMTHVEFRSD
ncbi:MAG: mycothiol system anti-sigma-R factor [Candidatus Nanopelagicales bacterium]